MTLRKSLLTFTGLIFLAANAFSQTVTTDPVGFINLSATAGTGTTKTVSVLSFPLLDSDPGIVGQATARITGVTANSISNSAAGWTAGALSSAAAPYLVQITSGNAKGRMFLISTATPNTATTVTLDAVDAAQVDLTTLGIVTGAAGDTYSVFPCDTISTLFGTPATTGIVGSPTSATDADVVQLFVSGAWRQYFYNTTSNDWRRIGPNTLSNNIVIRPDTGVVFSRIGATALNLTLLGRVPTLDRQTPVSNSGITLVSNSWPTDITLGTSSFKSIPGWVNGTDAASDVVQMFVSGAWRQYTYDGTNWRRIGPNTISDAVAIPAGTSVVIYKKGSATGVATLSQTKPYTL